MCIQHTCTYLYLLMKTLLWYRNFFYRFNTRAISIVFGSSEVKVMQTEIFIFFPADFKKSQKNEENQTNNFYERFKSEDFEDKTNGQKCENISSAG